MRKFFFIIILFAILFFNFSANSGQTFDVRQFGAKGDGQTLDTEAIQKALDECEKSGGGIVRLGPGTYLSKPIWLHSNTQLQLDQGAKLKATDNPQDFLRPGKESAKGSSDWTGFINGKNLTDIAIMGKGIIDGSGVKWWIDAEEARINRPGFTVPRPRMILLEDCKNVTITGVTLVNSPCFHLAPKRCENVLVEGVTILAPSISPNTDGIDPGECRNVCIRKCVIDTGDDNIAIKSGKPNPAHPNAATENIFVSDCTFLHGHGMSIGSELAGGVRNVFVRNCKFENTANGIRIKSSKGRGGLVENVNYSDITMKNVKMPITISSYYESQKQNSIGQELIPVYRNINIKNLTATSPYDDDNTAERIENFFHYYYVYHFYEPKAAGLIAGLPESPVQDMVFENVNIKASKAMTIQNAKNVTFNNVKIETQSGEPLKLENAQVVQSNTERKLRIILVGDSTVTDSNGWGAGFKQYLKDNVECINTAANGRSSKSFIAEGRWAKALSLKGDYYLIQFGHNDEPGKGERSTEPNTTYRQFMTQYIDDSRAIGAKPIFVTSLVRRQWDKAGLGKINSSLMPYVEVVKQLAKEKNVPLVDLHARSKELCEQLGKEKCWEFSPIKDSNQYDNTHLNAKGSPMFGRLVVEELVKAVPELKPYFRDESR